MTLIATRGMSVLANSEVVSRLQKVRSTHNGHLALCKLTLENLTLFRAKDMHESSERIMTTFGYARVSTDGQTLAAQDDALRAAGCAKVFAEKVSGAKTDRAELRKVVARLDQGDVLVVTRLDRLARST